MLSSEAQRRRLEAAQAQLEQGTRIWAIEAVMALAVRFLTCIPLESHSTAFLPARVCQRAPFKLQLCVPQAAHNPHNRVLVFEAEAGMGKTVIAAAAVAALQKAQHVVV